MDQKLKDIIARAIEHAQEVNNYADCDVIQEAITQLETARDIQGARDAFEYLTVSIEYRKRLDKVTRQLFFEFKARMLRVEFEAIAATVPVAYLYKDGTLLKVENAEGFAICVNKSPYGFQLNASIRPNTRTGSSVGITGDSYSGVTLEKAIEITRKYRGQLNAGIYSREDIATIKFISAEESLKGWMDSWTKI